MKSVNKKEEAEITSCRKTKALAFYIRNTRRANVLHVCVCPQGGVAPGL